MTSTQKRLAALEARTGARHDAAVETKHGRIWSSLFDALHTALPDIDETYRVPSKLYSHAYVTEGVNINSMDRIIALGERIETGQATDDDLAVLASLSVIDLQVIGDTPESFVIAFLNMTRIY